MRNTREGEVHPLLLYIRIVNNIHRFAVAVGEILNFVAYTIAPAILVTPLGALRVIVRNVYYP